MTLPRLCLLKTSEASVRLLLDGRIDLMTESLEFVREMVMFQARVGSWFKFADGCVGSGIGSPSATPQHKTIHKHH